MESNGTDKVMDPPSMQFHSSLDLVKSKYCIGYASEQEKRGAISIIEKHVDLSIDEKPPLMHSSFILYTSTVSYTFILLYELVYMYILINFKAHLIWDWCDDSAGKDTCCQA